MNPSRYTKHGLILTALCAFQAASHAGPVDLTDTPLPVQSSVPPNILFMLDTSGSMSNIVPDAPYDPTVTYLTSCPTDNLAAGGVAAPAIPSGASYDINIVSGVVTVGSLPFGTATGQLCFDSALRYNARLLHPVSTGYLGTAYEGNFLNWYFCTGAAGSCNSRANFGSSDRKPGTLTRMQITQTAASTIVNSLSTVRTGLSRYNSSSGGTGGELTVQMDFNTATQKSTVTNAIRTLAPFGATPLAETLSGIGAYFAVVPSGTGAVDLTLHPANPTSGMSPANLNRSTASAATVFSDHGAMLRNGVAGTPTIVNPIQYACQKSFAVVMTDGRPQADQSVSSHLCDYLGVAGGCATADFGRKTGVNGTGNGTGANAGYHVSGSNRQLHIGDPHGYETQGSDYLDDVASALYEIDLRPDLTKRVGQKNNVVTYMIGFADLATLRDPLMQETAAAGGGLFSIAGNSNELVTAFQRVADDILAKDGSASAVAVANAHITNTDNASYSTSYNSGTWTGDLIAYPINTTTGVPDNTAPIWNTGCASPTAYVDPTDATKGVQGCSAQVLLDLRTADSRKIFTTNDTATCTTNCGIPFQPTTATGTEGVDKLSAAQQTLLNTPSVADGAAVIDYLRGVRTGETAQAYRTRAHLLGDMVSAEPLVIREPERNYLDLGYDTFKTSKANRARIIFQASNDGMAHAFDALTGAELWAYVPNMLISDARDPASATTSVLNTRTRKTGFTHYFLLDGTPVTSDVDFANAGVTGVTTTDWRTIVVGGMGKGGRGYYALDVTSTVAATESAAASKALWEFPRSITDATLRAAAVLNMGYSYGKPAIVKTEAKGWVVLIASGYNNGIGPGESGGDGLGHLYVVNAKTGDLIADLITPRCHLTPTTHACGLAHINAFIENKDQDETVELAYGGDLYGNVWRFDLRGPDALLWAASKMATLRSANAAGAPVQPITTVPELSKITIGNDTKYFVYIGTGLFLGKTDLPCPPSGACAWSPNAQSTQIQTMYGLVDPRDTTTLANPLRNTLVEQTYTTTGTTRTLSTNAVDYATKNGWFVDFINGERLVTDTAIASGMVVFTSIIPSTTPCVAGGSSWFYSVDYQTGGKVDGALPSGVFLGDATASRVVVIQKPNGGLNGVIKLGNLDTSVQDLGGRLSPVPSKRVSWRELIDN